jgi:hypothetical protein
MYPCSMHPLCVHYAHRTPHSMHHTLHPRTPPSPHHTPHTFFCLPPEHAQYQQHTSCSIHTHTPCTIPPTPYTACAVPAACAVPSTHTLYTPHTIHSVRSTSSMRSTISRRGGAGYEEALEVLPNRSALRSAFASYCAINRLSSYCAAQEVTVGAKHGDKNGDGAAAGAGAGQEVKALAVAVKEIVGKVEEVKQRGVKQGGVKHGGSWRDRERERPTLNHQQQQHSQPAQPVQHGEYTLLRQLFAMLKIGGGAGSGAAQGRLTPRGDADRNWRTPPASPAHGTVIGVWCDWCDWCDWCMVCGGWCDWCMVIGVWYECAHTHHSHATPIDHSHPTPTPLPFTTPTPLIHHPFTTLSPLIHHSHSPLPHHSHSPLIHHPFTTHSSPIHHSFTTHSPLIHHSCTTHTPLIHHSFTTHSPLFHHPFTTHSRLITMQVQSSPLPMVPRQCGGLPHLHHHQWKA